jgi:hypothetical protein
LAHRAGYLPAQQKSLKKPLAFCSESQAPYRRGPGGSAMAGQTGYFDGDDQLKVLSVLAEILCLKLQRFLTVLL